METYSIFKSLCIIVITAKLFGIIARKLKAPQVVGEILAGVVLGPSLLGWVAQTDFLTQMAEIGVVLLMFSAGLQTNLKDLVRTGAKAFLIACAGVFVPLIGGTLLYFAFYGVSPWGSPEFYKAVFIGVIMTATSVSITVQTLKELGKIGTVVGTTVLSAAIIDDVIGIIVLTFVIGINGGEVKPLTVVLKTVLFFVFALVLGYVIYKVFRFTDKMWPHTRRIPIMGLAICFGLAFVAERFFGIADITGAYVAGIILCSVHDSDYIAEKMDIQVQRVALRGEDVMKTINFIDDTYKKDSLLVTPIGICLNYYNQSNNFIFVTLNGERVKLYDNGKLHIVDALMQGGVSNSDLFPKRGDTWEYMLNGEVKSVKGELGEAAVVYLNDELADLYTNVHTNDIIKLEPSTKGDIASISLSKLAEYKKSMSIFINGNKTVFPVVAKVNGDMTTQTYVVKPGDEIEILNYYTVEQILSFLDVDINNVDNIIVNNTSAYMDTKVYENFSMNAEFVEEVVPQSKKKSKAKTIADKAAEEEAVKENNVGADGNKAENAKDVKTDVNAEAKASDSGKASSEEKAENEELNFAPANAPKDVVVFVNNDTICLRGKSEYVFVDVFDYIDFDLSAGGGRKINTLVNGKPAEYMQKLNEGDSVEIYWG